MGTDYVLVVLVVKLCMYVCRIQDCTPVCGTGHAPPTEVSASAGMSVYYLDITLWSKTILLADFNLTAARACVYMY